MRRVPVTAALLVAVAAVGCESAPELPAYDAGAHRANVEEWRAWRHSELVKPDGWLSLSGLYWLVPGTHRLGSDPENELVYAREGVPALLGSFRVTETRVEFYPESDAGTTLPGGDGGFAGALVYDAEIDGERPIMQWGDMQWYVIEREDHIALRLKDGASELVTGFEGMDNFDLAAEWRLDATFEYLDPPGTMKVPNVFGSLGDVELLGAVVFEHGGETYRLDMWRDSSPRSAMRPTTSRPMVPAASCGWTRPTSGAARWWTSTVPTIRRARSVPSRPARCRHHRIGCRCGSRRGSELSARRWTCRQARRGTRTSVRVRMRCDHR